MRLLSAEVTDFRNIASAQLDLSVHFNALIGENGQGKTNTLEALYMVAALRPLRSVTRRALIRSGAPSARIAVRLERRNTGLVHDLAVELDGARRTLIKDDNKVSTSSFIGCAVAVAFTPDDLQLAKSGPDARRRFLDRALLNVQPAYLQRALRYQKAVRERNRVLSEQGPDGMLDAFDEVIATEGASMMVARARYVDELAPRVKAAFERIASPAPELIVRYRPRLEGLDPSSEPASRARFLEELGGRRGQDRARRTTSVGPHLDDLVLELAGAPAKDRASQGQHRALVLALKLAEITHLAETLGEPPLLFLDDMSSELDAVRSRQLFDAVSGLDGQVILTSTEPPRGLLEQLGDALVVFDVRDGTLTMR